MSRHTLTGPSQNAGNKIGDIPSVKLHAPPGGSSSFSLAWGYEDPYGSAAPRGVRREAAARDAYAPPPATTAAAAPAVAAAPPSMPVSAAPTFSPYGTGRVGADISNIANYQAPAHGASAAPAPSSAAAAPGGPVCSSNAYATGANQNCGNFLTDRRTTKVHAPPGGRSSISFG